MESLAPSTADIEPVLHYLRACGHPDFRAYKPSTLRRRIERRAGLHGLGGPQPYLELLRGSPQEVALLARELLIGVTAFFRDAPVWEALASRVLPAWLAGRPGGEPLRAWVAGCSTGEEAYTLAMVLQEGMERLAPERRVPVQIFATDLNAEAIAVARRAVYPAGIAEELGPVRLQRHFVAAGSRWRVAQPLREQVIFACHDLLTAPPFLRLDLLSCRNVLIYLGAPVQRELFARFRYALRPGGLLLLGQGESALDTESGFEALDARWRMFRRPASEVLAAEPLPLFSAVACAAAPPPEPESAMPEPATLPGRLQAAADRLLLHDFAPPLVLVDAQGNILYTNGYIGAYLEAPAGRADWNLHAMARVGLRRSLADALALTVARGGAVELPEVTLEGARLPRRVHVTVRALEAPAELAGTVLITFRDLLVDGVPAPRRRGRRASDRTLEVELARARDEMQSLREEMSAAQEELRAANEELQSTNEELQSTNDELNASRQRLMTMNGELQALNHELQARLTDLVEAHSDLRNLQAVSEQAVVFLDAQLRVRSFTEQARTLLGLCEADVGLAMQGWAERLGHPQMQQSVQDTMRTLLAGQFEVGQPGGRRLMVRVRPYVRQDDRLSGAVLTFSDAPQPEGREGRERRGRRAARPPATPRPGEPPTAA